VRHRAARVLARHGHEAVSVEDGQLGGSGQSPANVMPHRVLSKFVSFVMSTDVSGGNGVCRE
jgi:hypothetical protein